MPTSFEAMHNQTRPLRLLDDPPAPGRDPVAPRRVIAILAPVLLVVLPLVAALLL